MEQQAGNKLFGLDIPVRWGDMDALGHVNNIMYFRYFEQVRLSWYESVGYDALASKGTGLLIVDNHAEYLKPLVYPAVATITMSGHSPGRSSFVSEYWLRQTTYCSHAASQKSSGLITPRASPYRYRMRYARLLNLRT